MFDRTVINVAVLGGLSGNKFKNILFGKDAEQINIEAVSKIPEIYHEVDSQEFSVGTANMKDNCKMRNKLFSGSGFLHRTFERTHQFINSNDVPRRNKYVFTDYYIHHGYSIYSQEYSRALEKCNIIILILEENAIIDFTMSTCISKYISDFNINEQYIIPVINSPRKNIEKEFDKFFRSINNKKYIRTIQIDINRLDLIHRLIGCVELGSPIDFDLPDDLSAPFDINELYAVLKQSELNCGYTDFTTSLNDIMDTYFVDFIKLNLKKDIECVLKDEKDFALNISNIVKYIERVDNLIKIDLKDVLVRDIDQIMTVMFEQKNSIELLNLMHDIDNNFKKNKDLQNIVKKFRSEKLNDINTVIITDFSENISLLPKDSLAILHTVMKLKDENLGNLFLEMIMSRFSDFTNNNIENLQLALFNSEQIQALIEIINYAVGLKNINNHLSNILFTKIKICYLYRNSKSEEMYEYARQLRSLVETQHLKRLNDLCDNLSILCMNVLMDIPFDKKYKYIISRPYNYSDKDQIMELEKLIFKNLKKMKSIDISLADSDIEFESSEEDFSDLQDDFFSGDGKPLKKFSNVEEI